MPAERSLREANVGIIDGDVARLESAVVGFPNLIKVDVPVLVIGYWVLVTDQANCPADHIELSQLTPVGVNGLRFFERVYNQSDVGYENADTIESMLAMLDLSRADYTVLPSATAAAYGEKFGISLERCLDEPLFSDKLFTYLNKRHESELESFYQAYREVFGGL